MRAGPGEGRSAGGWSAAKGSCEEVDHEIGDFAFAIPADVSKTSEISRLLDQTASRFGGLDFLLNNAGGFPNASLALAFLGARILLGGGILFSCRF